MCKIPEGILRIHNAGKYLVHKIKVGETLKIKSFKEIADLRSSVIFLPFILRLKTLRLQTFGTFFQ